MFPTNPKHGPLLFIPQLLTFICSVSSAVAQWEYFPTPTTWYRANELCMNQSGSLVSILTVDQNNALRQFIEQESGDPEIHAWTGGNDLAEEVRAR